MGGIAVINFISRQKTQTRQGLSALLNYCAKNAKTIHDGRKLVTGVNCVAQSAYNEMMNTKLRYPADNLGIDSAYLAADVMNILDNDSHVEDCTTNKKASSRA